MNQPTLTSRTITWLSLGSTVVAVAATARAADEPKPGTDETALAADGPAPAADSATQAATPAEVTATTEARPAQQEAAEGAPPPPRPTMHIAVPQAEPPVQRSYHVHDGFYLRVNAGLGGVRATFEDGGGDDITAKGSDLAMDLLVGGSPSRGVAIGGALLGNFLLAANLEQGSSSVADRDVGILLVGPFIDGFPNAKRGWHFGGAIGLASVRQRDLGPSVDVSRTTGYGAAAWAGYDAWIADEWCVGGFLRGMLTRSRDGESNVDVTAVTRSIALMFTALYH